MELKKINTMEDVEKFLRYVIVDLKLGWGFHPDDDFSKYIKDDGTSTFSKEESQKLNSAIDQCFEICDKYHRDIYHLGLQLLKTIE